MTILPIDHDADRLLAVLLGPRQTEIMRLFWAYGAMSGPELHQQMAKSALAYTTITSICNRLVENGLLERRLVSEPDSPKRSRFRAYTYAPLISEDELTRRAVAQRRDVTLVIAPPTPNTAVAAAPSRDQIERILAYLGSLRDAEGQRADDAALDAIAALLMRAEKAELRAAAWEEEARRAARRALAAEARADEVSQRGQAAFPPRIPDRTPIHEYRDPSGVCRVCGSTALEAQQRQDGLHVCGQLGCRKEAERRDAVYRQRRCRTRKRQDLAEPG